MTEAELRKIVVNMALGLGWRVYGLSMTRIARPVAKSSGYPDLTLARDRRVLWFELKQEAGLLSKEQMAWLHELPHCYVIRPSDVDSGSVRLLLS